MLILDFCRSTTVRTYDTYVRTYPFYVQLFPQNMFVSSAGDGWVGGGMRGRMGQWLVVRLMHWLIG